MRTHSFRHLIAVAAVGLASMAVSAACASAAVPQPSGQSPGGVLPGTATPGTATPGTATPSRTHPTATHAATGPPLCLGAVVYRVDASDLGSFNRPVCIAVGGVVRVEHLGPGSLSQSPSGRVSCWYEAGVHQCRLIRTGTVTFHVTRVPKVGSLTVMVAEASSPPKPSPACLSATTFTIDASDGGPPWMALCVKLGVVLRVENLGPNGFSVVPADTVSCRYEAGVRECRFVKTGTVTITTTHPVETRSLTVVVVK
jgi:hypothetical protein